MSVKRCHHEDALSYVPAVQVLRNLPLGDDMLPRLFVCSVDKTGGTQRKQLTKGRR